MNTATNQLAFEFETAIEHPVTGARAETRRPVAQRVEYAAYPRVSRDQRERVALGIDRSASGLCMSADSALEVGRVLRVVVRDLDDRRVQDALMRVVWCRQIDSNRFRAGLALVCEPRRAARFVRPQALKGVVAA